MVQGGETHDWWMLQVKETELTVQGDKDSYGFQGTVLIGLELNIERTLEV